jgi:hypothetical protein
MAERALGANLSAPNVVGLVRQILSEEADVTGLVRSRPLMPTTARIIELRLGGSIGLVHSERFRTDNAMFDMVRDNLREVYREDRAFDITVGSDHYRRQLQYWQDKYRTTYRHFIPDDLPDESPLPRGTSFGDTFDRADNSDLNALDTGKTKDGSAGTWQWASITNSHTILNNLLHGGSDEGVCYSRIDDDLAGVDHKLLATFGTHTDDATEEQRGPCVRFSSSASTSYMQMAKVVSTGEGTILRKTVTGSRTDIGSAQAHVWATGDTFETRIDGSTLSGRVNDVVSESKSDTVIIGGTRFGFYSHRRTSTDVTDLSGEDLAAGGGPPTLTLLGGGGCLAAEKKLRDRKNLLRRKLEE